MNRFINVTFSATIDDTTITYVDNFDDAYHIATNHNENQPRSKGLILFHQLGDITPEESIILSSISPNIQSYIVIDGFYPDEHVMVDIASYLYRLFSAVVIATTSTTYRSLTSTILPHDLVDITRRMFGYIDSIKEHPRYVNGDIIRRCCESLHRVLLETGNMWT